MAESESPEVVAVAIRSRVPAVGFLSVLVALGLLTIVPPPATATPERDQAGCRELTPVILILHGYGGTGQAMEATGIPSYFRSRGWATVTPTARRSTGRIWDISPGSPDVSSLSRMVRSVRCRDPRRTFVTGHSLGAHMASTMACETRLFAAAAPVSGVTLPPGCNPHGTKVLAFHGALDPLVPISGLVPHELFKAIPPWARTDRYAAVQAWAKANGCHARPVRSTTPSGQQITNYGCGHRLVVNPQGVHEWPRYANAWMLRFFRRVARTGSTRVRPAHPR